MNPVKQETDRLKELADRIQRLEDIKLIERLQRLYGYYLDNHMKQAVIDLFPITPSPSKYPTTAFFWVRRVSKTFSMACSAGEVRRRPAPDRGWREDRASLCNTRE